MRKGLRAAMLALLLALLATPAWAGAPVMHLITDTSQLDLAYIRDGELVTNLNQPNAKGIIARYTGADLGEAARRVSCTARFVGGGAVAIVAGPLEAWSVAGIMERSIHIVFASDGYHLGFCEGGVLKDVLTGEYTLDLSGETEYTFGFSISGDTITLQLPNGKTTKKKDARVKDCNGPRVIFEHYLTDAERAAGAYPAITAVYAKGRSLPALEDDFTRRDGLPVSAPSGHDYVQFRNGD